MKGQSRAQRLQDQGVSYDEMKARGFAPIEYRAYEIKARKRPFSYILIPWRDVRETVDVIEGLRARIEELESAGLSCSDRAARPG